MDKIHLSDISQIQEKYEEVWVAVPKFPGLYVRDGLTTQEMLQWADDVIDLLSIDETRVFNSVKFNVIRAIEGLKAFSNIEFTDEELEDYGKLYDRLNQNGLISVFYANLVTSDIETAAWVNGNMEEMIRAMYDYNNTAYGIMEGIVQKYKDTEFDVERLTNEMKDPDTVPFLKEVITKLG